MHGIWLGGVPSTSVRVYKVNHLTVILQPEIMHYLFTQLRSSGSS